MHTFNYYSTCPNDSDYSKLAFTDAVRTETSAHAYVGYGVFPGQDEEIYYPPPNDPLVRVSAQL